MIVGMKLRNGTLMHRELKSKQYIISYALKRIETNSQCIQQTHVFQGLLLCEEKPGAQKNRGQF